MAAYGAPETEVAKLTGIDPKTLRKHYRRELTLGHARANARVAEAIYRTALKGGREGTTAAIFWLKVRAGWSEFNAPRQRPPSKTDIAEEAAESVMQGHFAPGPTPINRQAWGEIQ